MKRLIVIIACVVVAARAPAQTVASRVSAPSDRALLTLLIGREDSRAPIEPRDARVRGLVASNPFIRAYTVRGLGRLENPATSDTIARLLTDRDAEVRVAAANALAQSVAKPLSQQATADARAANAQATERVRARLSTALLSEGDPAVRAALLESIGRLSQGSVDQVKATANLVAPSLSAADVRERRGAIRGAFFLTRKREARTAGAIPSAVTDRMYAMLSEPALAGFTPTDRFNLAFALHGAVALSDARSTQMLSDHDPYVRDRAVVNLSRSSDTTLVRGLLLRAMADPEPVVRFRAIGVYAQKLRAVDGCQPLVALTRDPNMNVALGATDALSGCRSNPAVAGHLEAVAREFRDDDRWHLPTRAFVSLAVVDSARARPLYPRFVNAKNFFVRMYADTAARLMRDTATLFRLSRDEHANVQASAIEGLSRIVGHAADTVYLRALTSDDNQVLMAASEALKGTSNDRVAAVATERWTARARRGWDTDADGTRALAGLLESLKISLPVVSADPPRIRLPRFEDLADLEESTARIEMVDGAVITMRLHPFDAPTNVFRFARLARAGAFAGLAFHRVAPFFVVQGPGPNANEYSAPDKPFARDELAASNVRGTVGLSTRGRDTGDGQIYINTVDNVWLDHEYTVIATITSGLEAFDRMQEGARIRRITITP